MSALGLHRNCVLERKQMEIDPLRQLVRGATLALCVWVGFISSSPRGDIWLLAGVILLNIWGAEGRILRHLKERR